MTSLKTRNSHLLYTPGGHLALTCGAALGCCDIRNISVTLSGFSGAGCCDVPIDGTYALQLTELGGFNCVRFRENPLVGTVLSCPSDVNCTAYSCIAADDVDHVDSYEYSALQIFADVWEGSGVELTEGLLSVQLGIRFCTRRFVKATEECIDSQHSIFARYRTYDCSASSMEFRDIIPSVGTPFSVPCTYDATHLVSIAVS